MNTMLATFTQDRLLEPFRQHAGDGGNRRLETGHRLLRVCTMAVLPALAMTFITPFRADALQTITIPIADVADDWHTVIPGSPPQHGPTVRVGGWDPITSGYNDGHFRFSFLRMPAPSVQSATLHLTAAVGAKWPSGAELLIHAAGIPCPGGFGVPFFGCGTPVVFMYWVQGTTYSIDVTTLRKDVLSTESGEMAEIELLLKPGKLSPLILVWSRESGASVAAELEIEYG